MSYYEQLAHLFSVDGIISLATLSLLEIVLGIDNIIFISIIASKLDEVKKQKKARLIGLLIALVARISLLFAITWIIGLKADLFSFAGNGFSGRDIILFLGGVFLLVKTTTEIHDKVTTSHSDNNTKEKKLHTIFSIVMQIVFVDIVFSFDSILTAVGIVDEVFIMIAAVIISMIIMIIFSEKVSNFVNQNPTIKMLALAFLLMIGFLLVIEAFDVHVPKQYIYSSMAFAFFVEILNMRARKNSEKKKLK